MKQLQLRITHTAETLHPMHTFEICHEDFHGSQLLHWNLSLSETNNMIFRIRGDPESYRARMDDRDDVLSYAITPAENGVFYCCVRERLTERDRTYVDAVVRGTIVVIPPINYNQDGTIDVSLVGSASDLNEVVDDLPEEIGVEVVSFGDYRTQAATGQSILTTRQYEAAKAAVNCGYYESPRQASLDTVADRLDVTPSTTAEHLRKAEKRVMRHILNMAENIYQ